MIQIQGLHNSFQEMMSLPEALPLPPQVVEETAPADEVMNPGLSPMRIFEEGKRREQQHLGEQKLVVAKAQSVNGWYNPFAALYNWAISAIYGTEEVPELTAEDQRKIRAFYEDVQKALKDVDSLFDEDDAVSFEQLLILIQKKREAEHRRNVVLQGESLKKAQVELKTAQAEVKQKTTEILDSLSRKGTLSKIDHLLAPLAGMIVGFGPFSVTGNPAIDVFAKPLLAAVSVLGAANIIGGEPFGEHLATFFDLAISMPVAFTGGGPPAILMAVSKVMLTLTKAHAEHTVKTSQGDLAILNHAKNQAAEKFNDLGGKASKAAQNYNKEIGALSRLLHENGELIQALFSR